MIPPLLPIQVCEFAAREGGNILKQMLGHITAREKGPKDLVTQADLASQQAIRECIATHYPEHGFLGEEDDPTQPAASDRDCDWIVDPLDGTVNFVHQLPNFSVSVAFRRRGRVECGCVYDPILDECFTAIEGGGAWLNGRPIRVSECEAIDQALVACSFRANVPRGSLEIARFVEVLHEAQAIRRLGSAALNLCYVAAGRLDAYWATSVKIWDIAAGQLLVTEAGGHLTDIEGQDFVLERPQFLATATPQLHETILGLLRTAKKKTDID